MVPKWDLAARYFRISCSLLARSRWSNYTTTATYTTTISVLAFITMIPTMPIVHSLRCCTERPAAGRNSCSPLQRPLRAPAAAAAVYQCGCRQRWRWPLPPSCHWWWWHGWWWRHGWRHSRSPDLSWLPLTDPGCGCVRMGYLQGARMGGLRGPTPAASVNQHNHITSNHIASHHITAHGMAWHVEQEYLRCALNCGKDAACVALRVLVCVIQQSSLVARCPYHQISEA
jgi:hypothetical protein